MSTQKQQSLVPPKKRRETKETVKTKGADGKRVFRKRKEREEISAADNEEATGRYELHPDEMEVPIELDEEHDSWGGSATSDDGATADAFLRAGMMDPAKEEIPHRLFEWYRSEETLEEFKEWLKAKGKDWDTIQDPEAGQEWRYFVIEKEDKK